MDLTNFTDTYNFTTCSDNTSEHCFFNYYEPSPEPLNISCTNQTEDTCTNHEGITRTVLLAIYIAIAVGGLTGNVLSFMVLHQKCKKSPVNVLLKLLALVDIIFLSFAILRFALNMKGCMSYPKAIIQTYVVPGIMTITQFLSVWIIVLLGFYRFMAICKPFKVANFCSKSKAKLTIVFIMFGGIIFWSPYVFRKKIVLDECCLKETGTPDECCYTIKLRWWSNTTSYKYFDGIFVHLGTMFLIPFVLLVFFNHQMMKELNCSCQGSISYCCIRRRRPAFSSTCRSTQLHEIQMNHNSREANEITKVVVTIIMVFFLTYSMYGVYILHTLIPVFDKFTNLKCSKRLFVFAIRTVALLNSSVNFIIYYVLRKSFRRKTKLFFHENFMWAFNKCKIFRYRVHDRMNETEISLATCTV